MSGYTDADILGYETQALSKEGPVYAFVEDASRSFREAFNIKAGGFFAGVGAGMKKAVASLRSFFRKALDINGDDLAANAEALSLPSDFSPSSSSGRNDGLPEGFDPYKIWGQPN